MRRGCPFTLGVLGSTSESIVTEKKASFVLGILLRIAPDEPWWVTLLGRSFMLRVFWLGRSKIRAHLRAWWCTRPVFMPTGPFFLISYQTITPIVECKPFHPYTVIILSYPFLPAFLPILHFPSFFLCIVLLYHRNERRLIDLNHLIRTPPSTQYKIRLMEKDR